MAGKEKCAQETGNPFYREDYETDGQLDAVCAEHYLLFIMLKEHLMFVFCAQFIITTTLNCILHF